MHKLQIALLTLLALLGACADNSDPAADAFASQPLLVRQPGSRLAYEHIVVVSLAPAAVADKVRQVTEACVADTANSCEVLQAAVASEPRASGGVMLRLAPAGVESMLALVAGFGEIERRETRAEDLARPLADNTARLAQLETYQTRLLALEQQSGEDIDALIKVAAELSQVQSQLEVLRGEIAFQNRRIDTELLNLRFTTTGRNGFWTPVGEALGSFTSELSDGIASAILGTAYVLPWLLLLLPLLLLCRWLWRRGKQG